MMAHEMHVFEDDMLTNFQCKIRQISFTATELNIYEN